MKNYRSLLINLPRLLVYTVLYCIIVGFPRNTSAQKIEQEHIYKVAAAQLSTVFLDLDSSLNKALKAIREASDHGARLIVFPEVFLSGYPAWAGYLRGTEWVETNELYLKLVQNSVTVPGPVINKLCKAAGEANINVVIGVHERNLDNGGTLYNTLVYISDQGKLLGKHRKLIPTYTERLIWGRGEADTFQSFDTSVGRIAGLICWENRMPLARTAVYMMGTQILVSPTADSSDIWLAAMRNAAWEGGMYVISVCAPERKDWIPDEYGFKKIKTADDKDRGIGDWPYVGNSCIIAPWGEIIAGPMKAKEGILYAEINLDAEVQMKQGFDAVGNYSRPDVFSFSFNKTENTGKKPAN